MCTWFSFLKYRVNFGLLTLTTLILWSPKSFTLAEVSPSSWLAPVNLGPRSNLANAPGFHFENWGESNMAEGSPRTDTSTDVDTDERNNRVIWIICLFICEKNIDILASFHYNLGCYLCS
jgi:hypothetical protein